jgi:putative transposase
MPRQARLDAPGTLHHVMIRGINGVDIFEGDKDREHFLSLVGERAKDTGTRILAWALMDNHVHILLFSGPLGLPKLMRRVLTGYAVWFNRRHQRSGHLFQNRYKSIVCEEDQYLLELVRYIHLNPIRSRVVKSLEELDRYRWSGHGVILGKVRRDWQEREYVLSRFGRKERKSIRAYRKYLEEGKGIGRRPELVGGGLVRSLGGWSQVVSLRGRGEEVDYDARILGSGDFVHEVMREAEERVARQVRNRGRRSIEEIVVKMCTEASVDEKEVRSGSRRRRVSQVRTEIACLLSREMGMPMAEIARRLGVGTSAIAMAIGRKYAKSN